MFFCLLVVGGQYPFPAVSSTPARFSPFPRSWYQGWSLVVLGARICRSLNRYEPRINAMSRYQPLQSEGVRTSDIDGISESLSTWGRCSRPFNRWCCSLEGSLFTEVVMSCTLHRGWKLRYFAQASDFELVLRKGPLPWISIFREETNRTKGICDLRRRDTNLH